MFYYGPSFNVNPQPPESVACKMLELLKSTKDQKATIDKWAITRRYTYDNQAKVNKIVLLHDESLIMELGWMNGEDLNRILGTGKVKTELLYNSGYYDARDFGFHWHE